VRRGRRTSDGRAPAAAAAVTETPVSAGPTSCPLVSIIVVCWNSADVLGRCLDGLFAQSYANREIIVVDDGSDDDTPAVVDAAATRGALTSVRSPGNRGCPSARNLGLLHARGEIVAFIDADGFASPRWIDELVKAFGEDASIGGLASTVFFDDNPMVLNGAGGIVNRQGWAADLAMNESYEDARIVREALYPMGCGMALRREALKRVGPFDDRMLNYYDDVDYGTRLWRAGYRVAVAADAWIDHLAGGGGESARKRLLCERHRMRVVLKHATARDLATWALWEARGLRSAASPVRIQKLKSLAWNLRHLASLLASRRRMRGSPAVSKTLLDASWGDGFPVGVAQRNRPSPELAGARVEMAVPGAAGQLLHGWFPLERVDRRSYRWAATSAAVLVHLDAPVRLMRMDFAHVPADIGGIDVGIRRLGSADRLAIVWETRLRWQYISRSVENHPLTLPPGDYEVMFATAEGWSDPPRETRSLAFALSSLSFARLFEAPRGGLDMGSPAVEQQLVSGWFEAEQSGERHYRWATGRAAAVVRLAEPASSAQLGYRLPPGPTGDVRLSLTPIDGSVEAWSTSLVRRDAEWHHDELPMELAPGEYLACFESDATWSNHEGRDPAFWAENRALGLAVRSLIFTSAVDHPPTEGPQGRPLG
jgi:GT2 family glycosyltransferase